MVMCVTCAWIYCNFEHSQGGTRPDLARMAYARLVTYQLDEQLVTRNQYLYEPRPLTVF